VQAGREREEGEEEAQAQQAQSRKEKAEAERAKARLQRKWKSLEVLRDATVAAAAAVPLPSSSSSLSSPSSDSPASARSLIGFRSLPSLTPYCTERRQEPSMPFSFASPSTASLRRLTKTAEAPQSAVQPIASSSATSVSSSEQGIAEQATAGFGEEQDGTGSDKIGRKERPVGKGEGEEKRMKEEEITLKRVLVVDDERVNRKIVSRKLERWGCRVETASGGAEAVGKAKRLGDEALALILMDINSKRSDTFY